MPAAALLRSLGDPAQLAIVRRLALGQARVVDLVAECGLAQSTGGHPLDRTTTSHLTRLELALAA